VILGYVKRDWQDADYVLGMFAQKHSTAMRGYRKFVEERIEQGKRPDLIGGWLLRSQGGWTGVQALRAAMTQRHSDELVLASSKELEVVDHVF
jgi:putative transposase